jgi:hypothetical protein
MIALNNEKRLEYFKRSQDNFAFGLQRIKNEQFIRGLEDVAKVGS